MDLASRRLRERTELHGHIPRVSVRMATTASRSENSSTAPATFSFRKTSVKSIEQATGTWRAAGASPVTSTGTANRRGGGAAAAAVAASSAAGTAAGSAAAAAAAAKTAHITVPTDRSRRFMTMAPRLGGRGEGERLQVTGYREQGTGYRLQGIGEREQVMGSSL